MNIVNFIAVDVKALKLTDTIGKAKKMFKDFIFTHIPVVGEGNLYGLIAESDLPSLDNDTTELENIQYMLQSFFAFDDINWVDLLKEFAINETNIIPVLSQEKKYIGYIELADVLHYFNKTPFLQENGTILIISKNKNDYSLSEVAQIVESNEAKLFGAFVSKIDNEKVELTIKVISNNINDVIHTFRRYDYSIILGIKEDEYLNDLKDRSAYLQKYLDI